VFIGESIWSFLLGVMLPNFILGFLGDIGKLVPCFNLVMIFLSVCII